MRSLLIKLIKLVNLNYTRLCIRPNQMIWYIGTVINNYLCINYVLYLTMENTAAKAERQSHLARWRTA